MNSPENWKSKELISYKVLNVGNSLSFQLDQEINKIEIIHLIQSWANFSFANFESPNQLGEIRISIDLEMPVRELSRGLFRVHLRVSWKIWEDERSPPFLNHGPGLHVRQCTTCQFLKLKALHLDKKHFPLELKEVIRSDGINDYQWIKNAFFPREICKYRLSVVLCRLFRLRSWIRF